MPKKLVIKQSKAFKKSYKKYKNDADFLEELLFVLEKLQNRDVLPAKYCDHELKGNFKGVRECHIRPDDLLLYFIVEDEVLKLVDLGSHAKVFGM
ncbi:type II toxin-antitoxin system YafQ family toxin [Thiotrichales bacterium 19S9-12]|nr:type II toxin-antitoxin system YafQ family toxin [Thiotrichales bacterium 19S9-11]MCF6810807.1 type II toxin-antitoxin system YafQ family toxin [Thiotrichales bacterium 19S9-12]